MEGLKELDGDDHLLHLEDDFSSLWQCIQGTQLIKNCSPQLSVCMIMCADMFIAKIRVY